VSPSTPGVLDDTHDLYDPSTFTTSQQRQQQSTFVPAFASPHPVPPRPSSASGSPRPLRRPNPRLEPRPSSHRRAASVDAAARRYPELRSVRQAVPVAAQRASGTGVSTADIPPALSEAETEGDASTAGDPANPLLESYWPPRATRVSPRTASAILWVLEEAIRKPFPFTPDTDELNASMSDLAGGGGSSAGNGQNGASRPPQVPAPVQTHHPAGVRTPTDIMRQRRDREARKKAEKEAREREQQEAELRQQQEQEQQYAAAGVASGEPAGQRRPVAAGVEAATFPDQAAAGDPGVTRRAPVNVATGVQQPAAARRPQEPRIAGSTAPTQRPVMGSQSQPRPAVSSSQQQPLPTTTGAFPQQQQPMRGATLPAQGAPQPVASGSQRPQGQVPQSSQNTGLQPQEQPRRSTFPHAFERWETLSSHWEGLTGYWIRKLEQNNDDLSRDPLNQQMARQITDLSAAGANLFHAVVELQRLRASSERKFQRWFFDTRAEQEKAREVQADLERQLKALRLEQADAAALRQKAEADRKKAEDLVKEMRRELQISKEEARRAWEELGRREQEERDRTASLRNGEPTLVGGVQVVPMMTQGMPSRQTSTNRPPTREGPYPGGPGPTHMGGQPPRDPTEEGQYYEEPRSSPTETDPFTEGRTVAQQETSQPPNSSVAVSGSHPATAPGRTTGRFYQHEGSALHGEPPTSEADDRSYVPSNDGSELAEEEYVMNPDGTYRLDAQGRRMVYARPEEGEEYGAQLEEEPRYERPYVSGMEHGSVPATSGYGYSDRSVDYSGSSWGGWESMTPRHRHPTRLSDVLEEDERSRTSASRASQASRSMH
jgi:hypothetical protein